MTVDTHDMLLIHRVIRREIGQLPDQFRRAAGDPARARRVTEHATEMLDFLHTHHSGEDEYLWPVLRPRVTLEADLIDRMEEQHHALAEAIHDVRADLATWASSADAETAERMARRLEDAQEVMTAHLAEEEERILPLVADHFSQEEWDRLGEHGFAAVPPKRRLVILAHILEEASPDEQKAFLKVVPPPARIAYRIIGRRQHARETAAVRG
jgi:hemerythrin-like domain-containing protein